MVAEVTYSLVIPVFNEEEVLPALFARLNALTDSVGDTWEIILVNDGSRDGSLTLIADKHQQDPRYRIIDLSRNFGHQIAITAGIDHAVGKAVIVMDADLQDPPEVIPSLIERWKQGYDVVSAKRTHRHGETTFKLTTARVFYRIINRLASVELQEDVGDFKLLDRKVVDALKSMKEQARYMRGMISWLGFSQTTVPYERHKREAGASKYPLFKMMTLAIDGIVGFSDVPLRMALWFGATVSVVSFFYGMFVVFGRIAGNEAIQGWTSTMVILSFLGGVILMMLGIVGLYVGRIYEQVKQRPLYLVERADPPAAGTSAARNKTKI